MKQIFKDFLFARHILVNDGEDQPSDPEIALSTIVALAKQFSIRITDGIELACESMIRDSQHNLGYYVPEPFYRGFPRSVLALTSEELYLDQLYHYAQTYGMGWFNEPGYSRMEKVYERIGFREYVEPKDFRIMDEEDAEEVLVDIFKKFLEGNRPLNMSQKEAILEGYLTFRNRIIPENDKIPCKDTVIYLLYESKDLIFTKWLKLSDVIKLLNYIQWSVYHSENLKKLNLKNQDRKFLIRVLDVLSSSKERCDFKDCFSKRKIWCGLFHHIHYHPVKYSMMYGFVRTIRFGPNMSYDSDFEEYMRDNNPVGATRYLQAKKGNSAVVRRLNYILSRCNAAQVEEVLSCLE